MQLDNQRQKQFTVCILGTFKHICKWTIIYIVILPSG